MKKNKIIAVVSLFVLSGCGPHEHNYLSKFKYNDEYHWRPAVCHPDEKKDFGYHDFGDVETNTAGVQYQKCIICGYKKYIDSESGGFSQVTQFAQPIDIHTDYQKRFLSYSGDYDKMPTNTYPDGSQNISDPVFTRIAWKYDLHSEDLTYSISISQNQDMTNSFTIMGDNKQEINAYNFFLGDNYYRINATDPFGTTNSSKVYKLTVDNVFPRNLYIGPTMTNCRDTGGREILDGKGYIRQGLLYRTCGNNYSQIGKKIDSLGKEIMTKQLNVKTELNLHNNYTYNFNFEDTVLYDTLMDYADGSPSRHHFSRNTESVKNVFEILAKKECYPIYYHCRIGTDRTGLVAILLNGVLGVDLNDIYQDYLFSNFGQIGSKRKIGTNEADDISNYVNEIQRMPGKNFGQKTYNALLTIGVPKQTIDKILDIYIEGEKPNYENDQIVVTADKMDIKNSALKSSSKTKLTERDNPAYYTTLSSGASASAKVNVDNAGFRYAYIYVGNNDASDSKRVESSITASIDGISIDIPSITFKAAGMGYCSGNRTNYYFVKLGDLGNISAGEHTITINGVANNLILGNIAVL